MPRKGKHKSDRRWVDERGEEWASRFESEVFYGLRSAGYRVRRADKSDSIAYTTQVPQGRCMDCGSHSVLQDRTYTADLYVVEGRKQSGKQGGYLVECKGFFARDKRAMFRQVCKELQSLGTDIRIIFESGAATRRMKGTKMTPIEYIHRYCKNCIPGTWDKNTNHVTWYET